MPITYTVDCPCCGTPPPPTPCPPCVVLPVEWIVHVSGVMAGTCSNCVIINGQHFLRYFPLSPTIQACRWLRNPDPRTLEPPSNPPPARPLLCEGVIEMVFLMDYDLYPNDVVFQVAVVNYNVPDVRTGIGTWTKPKAQFNCLASNTLTINNTYPPSDPGICSNIPSTVLIQPFQ